MSLSLELVQRRERLLLRSAQLRADWSQQVQVLRAPLGVADQARAGLQWLAHNPQWPLAAALVIVLLRPGRALRWGSYAWQAYGVFRRVQRLLARAPLGMHRPAR